MKTFSTQQLLGILRIALGLIFLWAFLDKTIGLEFATMPENAWLKGGSPTSGFLENATHGPLASFYKSLAGNPWVDGLFMIGLLGIGLALTLGIGMTIAGYSGALLMVLMWSAMLPPKNNPLLDEHLIYALILLILPKAEAGKYLGLGSKWVKSRWVKRYPFLT